jgi:hypothetical protein
MIRALDTVFLKRDLQEHGLREGDIGAVIHRYRNGTAYEVEFSDANGQKVALVTLTPEEIVPAFGSENAPRRRARAA